jgi:integrase
MPSQPTVHLLVVERDGGPVYYAKWRHEGRQIKRRIGRAWIVRGDAAPGDRRHSHHPGWIKRRGRPADDYLTADMALANVPAVVAAWEAERAQLTAERVVRVTFDEAAAAWLDHARTVRGIKPSTLADYTAALRQPDYQPKRRGHKPVARIMAAFGGRPIDSITSTDISRWLTKLDRDPVLSARTVNKYRQILHAIFKHACRADTFALAANPVAATEKRREADLAEIVTYSPAEVFAIARALSNGEHRDPRRPALSDEEIAVRQADDEQDAALVILAGFAGLRMGELLALRWRHVNFQAQRLHIQRSYSAGEESSPKGRKGRTVPLADQPARALARLGQRPAFTAPGDLVFCSRIGSHLDGSALRRRYKRARDVVCADAPDMPALRFHDLRHTFGTLAASSFDLVNVQAMLGHADARTTSRYLHARPAAEDAAKLSAIFGSEAAAEVLWAQ